MGFSALGNPFQKCFRGRLDDLVKFTFRADPRQNAFWGTLTFEVNFTGWGYPCQKYLRGRFVDLVKFTGLQEGHAHLLRAEQHLCFQEDLHRSVCLCRADLLLDRRGFLLLTEIPLAGDGHRRLSGNPLRSSNRSISSDFPSTTFTHRFSALIQ